MRELRRFTYDELLLWKNYWLVPRRPINVMTTIEWTRLYQLRECVQLRDAVVKRRWILREIFGWCPSTSLRAINWSWSQTARAGSHVLSPSVSNTHITRHATYCAALSHLHSHLGGESARTRHCAYCYGLLSIVLWCTEPSTLAVAKYLTRKVKQNIKNLQIVVLISF